MFLADLGQWRFHMIDFLIGLAFVAMIVAPAIAATIQRSRTHEGDL
jgi:hypothetical protein